MNDIPQSSQSFRFILYADDTNLFTTVEYSLPISISNVSEILNNELKEINDWLYLNKLTLNIQKTKFMVFHPYQKDIAGLIPMLKINDVEIEWVSSFKCLGILFDENMSWKCHTDMISNKLSKYTGILNKLKHYLPPYFLRMLYFSMVNAHTFDQNTKTHNTNNNLQQIQRTHWTPFQNNGHSQVKRTARYKRPEILLQISPWNPPLILLFL